MNSDNVASSALYLMRSIREVSISAFRAAFKVAMQWSMSCCFASIRACSAACSAAMRSDFAVRRWFEAAVRHFFEQ